MADTGMKDQRRDATGAQRGGRRAEGSPPRMADRDDGTARGWSPSAPRDDPARESQSLATMFDRLAEAAAAHDGKAAGGMFGEIELAAAAAGGAPGQRLDDG
jgi:hypothetical protein